jgi:phosphatidylinositol alpha-mannosyltransferase
MKIGFVVDDTLDKPDGVQQYVLTLGKWLKQQGHGVHYLVGQSERSDIENVRSMSKNIKVRFNGNRLTIPLPTSKTKIRALLNSEKFDVLHVQMPHSPLFAARVVAQGSPHTAIVGTFHIAPYRKMETFATSILGVWLKRNLQYFDEVISVSNTAHDFAQKTFHISSRIIPNLVDLESYKRKGEITRPPTITFLGRLVPRKGCQHFIQALASLQNKYSDLDYQAMVCGDGEDRAKLEKLVAAHNLSERVTFLGRVTEEDKRKYLSQSSIAVFPSTGGESFGIVLIEAMAGGAGVVLAGDNPGYKNVMGTIPEAVITPQNHEEFAEKIYSCLHNPKLSSQLHAKQQQLVKQYDVNAVGPKVLACYKDAIAKRNVRTHNGTHERA